MQQYCNIVYHIPTSHKTSTYITPCNSTSKFKPYNEEQVPGIHKLTAPPPYKTFQQPFPQKAKANCYTHITAYPLAQQPAHGSIKAHTLPYPPELHQTVTRRACPYGPQTNNTHTSTD